MIGLREAAFCLSESASWGGKEVVITAYFPGSDRVHWRDSAGAHSAKVSREGSESYAILARHGLSQGEIDARVKNLVR